MTKYLNNAYKRVNIVTARRMKSNTLKMYWHGTTDKFLRKIMLSGLDASKAKEGVWVDDSDTTDQLNPSRKSYGGVYFTQNMMIALSHASQVARKFGGVPMLISALLQPKATLRDEDDCTGFLKMAFNSLIHSSEMRAAEIYTELRTKYKPTGYWADKYTSPISSFREAIFDYLKIGDSFEVSKLPNGKAMIGTIDRVLITALQRFLSYQNKDEKPGLFSSYDAANIITQHFHRIMPKETRQKYTKPDPDYPNNTIQTAPKKLIDLPAPKEAERNYAKAVDAFIKITKNIPMPSDSWSSSSIRILEPVGFRGRNRITSIICLEDYLNIKRQRMGIRIAYGKVPIAEFLEQYKKYIGDTKNVLWLNKSGKEIGSDDKLPISMVTSALIIDPNALDVVAYYNIKAYDLDQAFSPDGIDLDDNEGDYLDPEISDEQWDKDFPVQQAPPQQEQEEEPQQGNDEDDETQSDDNYFDQAQRDQPQQDESAESDNESDEENSDDGDDEQEDNKSKKPQPKSKDQKSDKESNAKKSKNNPKNQAKAELINNINFMLADL